MKNEITINEILDDLRAADEITRRYERRYWLAPAISTRFINKGCWTMANIPMNFPNGLPIIRSKYP